MGSKTKCTKCLAWKSVVTCLFIVYYVSLCDCVVEKRNVHLLGFCLDWKRLLLGFWLDFGHRRLDCTWIVGGAGIEWWENLPESGTKLRGHEPLFFVPTRANYIWCTMYQQTRESRYTKGFAGVSWCVVCRHIIALLRVHIRSSEATCRVWRIWLVCVLLPDG